MTDVNPAEVRKKHEAILKSFREKHGDAAGFRIPDGRLLVIGPPSEDVYNTYFNEISNSSEHAQIVRRYALACTVFPVENDDDKAKTEAQEIYTRYHALPKKAHDAANRLAGFGVLESVPTKEQRAKHGDDIAVFALPDGRTIVFGPSSGGDWDRCQNTIDSAVDRVSVLRELAICSVKTSQEELTLALRRYPALIARFSAAIQRLAGSEIEELGKD